MRSQIVLSREAKSLVSYSGEDKSRTTAGVIMLILKHPVLESVLFSANY